MDKIPFLSVMVALAVTVVSLNVVSIWVPAMVTTATQMDVAMVPALLALLVKSPIQQ